MILLPMVASADAVEIDGIYYILNNEGNVATVTSNPNKYTGSIVIPESVNYNNVTYSVTRIGDNAFSYCPDLTSVNIPNSVKLIMKYAFDGSTGLTTVIIPNSVISIDFNAFFNCSSLTSVTFGNNLTRISSYAFKNCTSLTSITIPINLTRIDDNVFVGCRLENVLTKNSKTRFYNKNGGYDTTAFSDRTYQHAMLYIPEGTWAEAVYDGDWYLFNNIREIAMQADELSSSRTYTLMDTQSFGYAVYDDVSNQVKMVKAFYSIDENDPNNCWVVKSQAGKKYLYNVGARKYARIGIDGNITLTSLATPVSLSEGDGGIVIDADQSRQWGFVKNNKIKDVTGIEASTSDKDDSGSIYYSLDGQRKESLRKGVNIQKMSDGTIKKVIVK